MKWDYQAVLEAVRAQTGGVIGPAPPLGGLSVTATEGALDRDLAGSVRLRLKLALNSKEETQSAALSALGQAHRALSALEGPAGDWQITGASVPTAAAWLGQDAQGRHLYGSVVEIRAFCPET